MRANLFIDHHEKICGDLDDDGRMSNRAGTGWEDFFTDTLAFFLSTDAEVLEKVCHGLMGAAFEMPAGIETQYQVGGDRPDVLIWLKSGQALMLEGKVTAPLGPRQLQRYLAMRPGGQPSLVALLAPNRRQIDEEVRRERRYLHPADRENFFWNDVYAWIPDGHPGALGLAGLRFAFREYMELLGLGLVRVSGEWGRLYEDRTIKENQRVQEAFGNRLAGVANYLRDRGFEVTGAEHKGLVGWPQPTAPFHHLVVKPRIARKQYIESSLASRIQSAVLSVSLVYDTPDTPEHARALYAGFGPQPFGKYGWVRVEPYLMTSPRIRLEFVCNLDQFLADDEHMAERLLEGSREVLDRILAAPVST